MKLTKLVTKHGTSYFYGLKHWHGRGSHFSAYAALTHDIIHIINLKRSHARKKK